MTHSPHSPLFGRRIHIAGTVNNDPCIATPEAVQEARELVAALVVELMRKGATFVVPVDDEKLREDGLPICFDWLIWETLDKNLSKRPTGAPSRLAIAVQHHKTEEQVPAQYGDVWDRFRYAGSDLVLIENANQWNMASKRMELQAQHGDILLTLGGCEGVQYLANLYHSAGRPVIPLNLRLCPEGRGSRKLFEYGLTSANTRRLFRTQGAVPPHTWLNRLNFGPRLNVSDRVRLLMDLLEDLEPPTAFAVRLLNPTHKDYPDVQDFFDSVVKPVVETEYGYKLVTIDGKHANIHARVDQEIFEKLHHASVVIADLTGDRPNCFIELGYALGRGQKTMLLSKEPPFDPTAPSKIPPFDIASVPQLFWKTGGSIEDRKSAFRAYWEANIDRPSLVTLEPLIS